MAWSFYRSERAMWQLPGFERRGANEKTGEGNGGRSSWWSRLSASVSILKAWRSLKEATLKPEVLK